MNHRREGVNNENKRVGRQTRFDTLTKIANKRQEDQQIYSKELILLAQDGSEKKKKTILTNHEGTTICKNEKHYRAYEYITRESLENNKTRKRKT